MNRASQGHPPPAVRYTMTMKLKIPNHTARQAGGTNRYFSPVRIQQPMTVPRMDILMVSTRGRVTL